MLLGEPPRTQADLHFSLLGIPVRVHPFFWVIAVLLGLGSPRVIDLIVWVAAVFLSVLVHELGHALVMRRYGFSAWITLYGLGGLASRGTAQTHGPRWDTTWREVQISAAGPGAQLLLVLLVGGGLKLAGFQVLVIRIAGFLPLVFVADVVGSVVLTSFINSLLVVSVFWPVINLLPVYPLDGGHIARDLLLKLNPWNGIRLSLMLSMITGIAVAVFALVTLDEIFLAILFGYLAYSSYATLQAHQSRGPW